MALQQGPLSGARVLLVPVVLAVIAAGCIDLIGARMSTYVETDERRFPVTGQPEVSVTTFDGTITVQPWERREVLVVVNRRGDSPETVADIDVTARQDGDRIVVEARNTKRRPFHFSKSASITVSLPAVSNLTARTGDGGIELSGLSGRFDLNTGDGRIVGDDLIGVLNARTGDGSIKLRAIEGTLNVQTGDGSVQASGRLASVRARTGDGSVAIHADAGSLIETAWDISTGDGAVTVALPPSFNAQLEAYTGDGRIKTRDISIRDASYNRGKRSLRGRIGDGGGALRLRTGDGSITIQQ